jgi:hypothetical protein
LLSGALADGDVELAQLAAAHDLHRYLLADPVAAEQGDEVVVVAYRFAVQGDDGVAEQDPGSAGGAIGLDVGDQQPGFLIQTLDNRSRAGARVGC